MDVITAGREPDRFDTAFAGNRLLATLPEDIRDQLQPHATFVQLGVGQPVMRAGELVTRTLFPFDSAMVSLIVDLAGGRSVEVASIGKEGAVGGIVSCGSAPAFTRAHVQIAGPALAIPLPVLEAAKRASPFLEHLFCRFSDYLLAQVMQSVACNAFHSIEERAARWLLTAHDRAGDRLALTQESLASLLGAQRTTVNAVARELQEKGLIAYRRGAIEISDRPGLLNAACECYSAVEDHFAAVIGETGEGEDA
ncbi:Crp/Fnr family transcriptional regulator [Sphingomonas ginkgonis]|uniref:Crp/Fnr family transcriptional regulator n=1 Tax=Sphingomonas ginkgonis TaxID=2315330 RepID=A0A3R9WP40_9SPHN|nr:Crp/Fnr family transcriptional regulator [Sphingomonas ginkgonis]RST30029.1 Crp/Fnr family transcriptional regulator [Sphingomonas ginkgonis]